MSDNKHDQEEEYFHREDQEKLRLRREALAAQKAAEQEAALKALHYFHCGKCGHKMETQLYHGVEIEVCPHCGAVLLDPGELQQLTGDGRGAVERLAGFFNFFSKPEEGADDDADNG